MAIPFPCPDLLPAWRSDSRQTSMDAAGGSLRCASIVVGEEPSKQNHPALSAASTQVWSGMPSTGKRNRTVAGATHPALRGKVLCGQLVAVHHCARLRACKLPPAFACTLRPTVLTPSLPPHDRGSPPQSTILHPEPRSFKPRQRNRAVWETLWL